VADQHNDVLVIGDGFTARIAAVLLSRAGLRVGAAVVDSRTGDRPPGDFPSPVLPTIGSALSDRLWHNGEADLKPTAGLTVVMGTVEYTPASFLQEETEDAYIVSSKRRPDPYGSVLTRKLVGPRCLSERLPELGRKISRKYDGGRAGVRAAFVAGQSPYRHWLRRTESAAPRPLAEVIRVQTGKLVTNTGRRVTESVLLCSPLPEFAAMWGESEAGVFDCESAELLHVAVEGELGENLLFYDCDWRSPVYRVFTVDHGSVVVQLAKDHHGATLSSIEPWLERLVPGLRTRALLRRVRWSGCYPLDRSQPKGEMRMDGLLRESGVVPFGRVAQWQYLDLCDLNWSVIDEAVQRCGRAGAFPH